MQGAIKPELMEQFASEPMLNNFIAAKCALTPLFNTQDILSHDLSYQLCTCVSACVGIN